MKLASIQSISSIEPHGNADSLEMAHVLGYTCIVKKGEYTVGQSIVFIEPDTVLPDAAWSALYKARSNRVKTIRLRGRWSMGIVESIARIGYIGRVEIGLDISEAIGVTKYDPPIAQELNAKGLLPYDIGKTDEERWQSLESVPYGAICDVTQKIDGQSSSYYCYIDKETGVISTGVCGRTLEYQPNSVNNYTIVEKKYDILAKLTRFCQEHAVSICVRGEVYGGKIQSFANNPHSGLPINWAMFSVYILGDNNSPGYYARKGHMWYSPRLASSLGLPHVPVLECEVSITTELITKYDEGIETLPSTGKPFEGVVCQHAAGSFKIINKYYDSKK